MKIDSNISLMPIDYYSNTLMKDYLVSF